MPDSDNLFQVGKLAKIQALDGVSIWHISLSNWEYFKNNGRILPSQYKVNILRNDDVVLILDNSFPFEKNFDTLGTFVGCTRLKYPLFLFHFRCQANVIINSKFLLCLK